MQAVQVEWTPHCVRMDSRMNDHLAADKRVPLTQRLATFEGACRCTHSMTLNKHVRTEAEHQAASIALSLGLLAAPSHRIARLLVTFVQDSSGGLWVSWLSDVG